MIILSSEIIDTHGQAVCEYITIHDSMDPHYNYIYPKVELEEVVITPSKSMNLICGDHNIYRVGMETSTQ